jgi:DNA-binding SARP family transcriptional activator
MTLPPPSEAHSTATPTLARLGPPAEAGEASLVIVTLGGFRVWRDGQALPPSAWRRDKALQLLQYLVSQRRRRLEREQIIDALWPDLDPTAGERDFKVALNAVLRALEPERAPRAEPRFVERLGHAYGLAPGTWIDAEALEAHVAAAHHAVGAGDRSRALAHYQAAAALYDGEYLPERAYEEWTILERERLQMLALGAMTRAASMLVDEHPLESLRLAQRALRFDPAWESAWRLQMRAHRARGDRAQVEVSWRRCVASLATLGLEPLDETRAVYQASLSS